MGRHLPRRMSLLAHRVISLRYEILSLPKYSGRCGAGWRQAAAATGLLGVQDQQRARGIEAGDKAFVVGTRDGEIVVRREDAPVGPADRS
jgi:hypothetical protein